MLGCVAINCGGDGESISEMTGGVETTRVMTGGVETTRGLETRGVETTRGMMTRGVETTRGVMTRGVETTGGGMTGGGMTGGGMTGGVMTGGLEANFNIFSEASKAVLAFATLIFFVRNSLSGDRSPKLRMASSVIVW